MRAATSFASVLSGQAVRSLARNKQRSGLAAIAVMIGIGAVVCVVRAGSARAAELLQKLGDNLVWVEAGSRAPNGVRTGNHGTNSLTPGDAEAILGSVSLIKRVSPNVDGSLQLVYGNKNWRSRYRGVNPDYLEIKHWEIAEGASFTDEDVRRARSVCLIGQTVRQQLFGKESPVGQIVRVEAQLMLVVGVLAAKGQAANGQDQDDTVLLPWAAVLSKIKGKGYSSLDDLLCSAISPQAVVPAIAEITGEPLRPSDLDAELSSIAKRSLGTFRLVQADNHFASLPILDPRSEYSGTLPARTETVVVDLRSRVTPSAVAVDGAEAIQVTVEQVRGNSSEVLGVLFIVWMRPRTQRSLVMLVYAAEPKAFDTRLVEVNGLLNRFSFH